MAARREQHDELRRTTCCSGLGAAPRPGLGRDRARDDRPAALGMAVFVPMDELLAQLPPPDSVDVVLVLGAAALGVEHLLLTRRRPA